MSSVAVLFLAAGALPTRHDRFGLSADEVVARSASSST